MGNGNKSAQKRERNAAKKKPVKGEASTLKAKAAAMSQLKCSICMTPFQVTSSEKILKGHAENKHPKKSYAECFPSSA
jgi:hypothetical protein